VGGRVPARAEAVNVAGPRALATSAAAHGAGIVHFSSNYVFDGEPWGRAPYTIDDPPAPVNVYGRTKLEGERAVAAGCARSWIVRTSWVYGPGKANFLTSAPVRLRAGETVRAATDLAASTTNVDDLVARVLELVDGYPAGIYHVVNAGSPTQLDFAREAGHLVDAPAALVEPGTEAALGRPARRPRWTPMRCLASERLGLPPLRDWRVALADYVHRHVLAGR
jgi:dTDP-4-dehydrorhamnose reductase